MYRYFYFNAEMVEPYIEDMVRRIRSLIENHKGVLAECVDMIAYEREVKARMKDGVEALKWVGRGWGSIVEMLKQLCVKRNVRQVLYVNWQPLPVVAAARKVESLLRKGETVTIMTEDRGVAITASSFEELRSKIAQLLVEG
jgi:flagellar biosynthesis regulator FlaF